MPALSPTMEKGTIAQWVKQEGERVEAGDVVAEVETDKATVAFESVEEGYLAKILVQEGGSEIPVGTLVAILAEEQEDIAKFANFSEDAAPAPAAAAAPEPAAAPAAAVATPAAASTPAPAAPAGGRVFASPKARMLAREKGIDIATVQGTGPDRRVIAADVQEFTGASAAEPAAAAVAATPTPSAPAPTGEGDFEDIPLTNMRKVIASRLLASKQTIPHYYLTMDCCMDNLLSTRASLNATREKAERLSVNDFIVKASAVAMREVPEVNSAWMDTAIRQYNYVDVCVAVSTPTGLITPIVKDADCKGLQAISSDTKDLATRARAGKLDPSEYQGGTFTISNLGMFGINHFTAIINPPQSAILAVGTTVQRVVPNPDPEAEDKFITKNYMQVTLSCDHRVIDGAVGSQWLQAFKKNMEDPLTMLL